MRPKIRVMLVDDSVSFRTALAYALVRAEPSLEIVAQAGDGKAALEMIAIHKPDVITMDVMMPGIDGVEAARTIMQSEPRPIILLTALARLDQQRMAFNALRLGVVEVLNKPQLVGEGSAESVGNLARLIRVAADVGVPRHMEVTSRPRAPNPATPRLIAIAASTGGPPLLEQILQALGPTSPPVVIAQHLAPSFAEGFAHWMSAVLKRPAILVTGPVVLQGGGIYIAADGHHLRVQRGRVEPLPAVPGSLSPSADLLLTSVATAYGKSGLGIVLTGMGDDGTVGLTAMRKAGAYTIAQEPLTAAVGSMPQSAINAGACVDVMTVSDMAKRLAETCR